ncbi:Clp protease N-terminal domain-containing protein [Actinacidiphila soli]|jgi:ATP-dependent Clp protease ATP-binding subunit ClpA|uniref:Clp protease N-terminal domain-containing protein n=1 Tax=Actinacidiphila soli TaxID=2487275 RepID=UPI000FCAD8AF|nr:Clp protease N-terminal domain-containing protein [Actinacidiphila soli]
MDDAGLSVELRAVATSARRRAARDGDRQLDTAHLLHSLLENDPRVRDILDGGSGDGRLVRVLGYLVQRSIGYGMRWRESVEDSGALPVVPGLPGWSPSAAAAVKAATARARDRGVAQSNGTDLLAALAADPECRAAEVLRHAGVEPRELLTALPDQRRPVSCYGGDGTVAS